MPDPRAAALDYLATHHVMTLATAGGGGPWAAAVFYVNDGFTLTFLSSPSTRHATDFAEAGWAAAAIHEDYSEWRSIKGVQLEGPVHRLSGGEQLRAMARYAGKFPIASPSHAPVVVKAALARVAWYELVPVRCHFIDNAKGFGHRSEVEL